MEKSVLLSFLAVSLFVSLVFSSVDVGGTDGLKKMSFKTPDLTEEDSHSLFIPAEFKCDACLVVAYQMFTKFDEFNKAHKQYKHKLPESEILDLVEGVCKGETYHEYGVKVVKEKKRLSGPGLDTKDFPGVIAGGGKWPNRLMRVCTKFVDEIGEEEIYDAYRSSPESRKSLEKFLCQGTGIQGDCSDTKRMNMRVIEL